jgi:hypothetical protein
MILFPPKSRYFKSNIPDIIFKISCFRQKNNSPKIDTLSFHRPYNKKSSLMKKFTLFFILIANFSLAQNVEILLIGASHNYGENSTNDFTKIQAKIRQFKPDAFFGEYRSKEDERLLMDYWAKSGNIERLKILKAKRPIVEKDLPKVIADLKATITKNPEDWKARIDIAHAYFLDQDVSNAAFQLWQVYNRKSALPNDDIIKYAEMVVPTEVDSLHKPNKRYFSSEYHYIVYPMMLEMGFKEIYPMDCQVYDMNYQMSVNAFWTQYEEFQKDTIEGFNADFKKLERTMYAAQNKKKKIEKTDKYPTEYFNTDEAGKIGLSFDYLVPEMYDFKGFPKEAMLSAIHWWNMRNMGMCENTVTRAKALEVKRVVILVGANHRMGMQAIFEKMPNVKVWNINDFGK